MTQQKRTATQQKRMTTQQKKVAKQQKSAGFTLIEMIAALAISCVLFGLGVPSFVKLMHAHKVKIISYELLTTMNFARSEAIKRNSDVSIEPISLAWHQGWQVKTAAGDILKKQDAFSHEIQIEGASEVTFKNNGRIESDENILLEVSYLDDLHATKRCMQISTSGRLSLNLDVNQNGDCSDG